ncbi:multicopper oxidase domain-containing protein [Plantactinospora sp. KLBMP9567]|uniref:multicopper oxidase domain-containing protein n=1 Tax=Plantactinospora sp. KLBMP9567 TaxID=3085900 RepID=UPI002981CFB5|nr:multicopper oxidase domain-containing protein [Plantactinospora sp. KLBMP9567]MDW5323893.1 multicopper oxidase domain-containing protein [Plantactinospora sp. KLBMP9567]
MFRRFAASRAARAEQARRQGGNSGETGTGRAGTVVPAARTGTDPLPAAALDPTAPPDYFGFVPNFAYSPLPVCGADGRVAPGTGIRKFVTSLPRPGDTPNELGNLIPVAVPDTTTYPGCDYYEIGVQEYHQRLHPDLPPTRLRGYRQLNNGTDDTGHNTVAPPVRPYHLGPLILAQRDRPVRVKYVNRLPVGEAGALFLPVDPTLPGAGTGPLGDTERYPQNRSAVHLHGGRTPWISNGGPAQWTTPAGESTSYPRGAGYASVPDMPDPGAGATTAYYPNQQSGRLLWFHDQAEGIARLTVYSGQVGLYRLDDPVQRQLVDDGVLPAEEIVLVLQDKTFVPDETQLAAEDPTWDVARWGGPGSLWFPHVYMPSQNPYNESGTNPMGRWDYGPWFWPPFTGITHGAAPNPYYDPATRPWEPPVQPGTPTPSAVPDAFLDTPLVNGAAYPYLRLRPAAYRFRILNACNDRSLNLQLHYAASDAPMWHPDGTLRDGDAGEVPMVAARPNPDFPPSWPTDGRCGGVPDPNAAGPDWIQIGSEGGLLPAVAVLPSQPINYQYNRRDVTVLNVTEHALLLAPGERADVVVDFSSVPPGSNLILYNDCPAPMPGFDPRNDHYTGAPDRTSSGGPPTTRPGYGPNTRTLMQIQVVGTPAPPFDTDRLRVALPRAYGQSQPPPIVPQKAYDAAFDTATPRNTYVPIDDTSVTFTPYCGGTPVTLPLRPKAIVADFDPEYGRMNFLLGTELPKTSSLIQTTIPLTRIDPPTEVLLPSDPAAPVGSPGDNTQLWKITHNGMDTQSIHFHHVNVQLVNRVGRDGAIKPPEPNEVGWKDTVRMNPFEATVVAIRPTLPEPLPFTVPDSTRLHDPTRPAGTSDGYTQVNSETGEPAAVTNRVHNFGWEYVWHCQLLGHADAQMARPMVLRFSPAAPTGLAARPEPGSATVLPAIVLAWTDNSRSPAGTGTAAPPATGSLVQRATDAGFTRDSRIFAVPAGDNRYVDSTVVPGLTYYYRVRTENSVAHSAYSNPASTMVQLRPPTGLVATVASGPPLRVNRGWVNRSFATTVDLQRATNPTFTSGLVTSTVPVTGSCPDPRVAPDTTYYYRVRTCYLGATSPWSNVSTVVTPAVPATPTDLAVTLDGVAGGPGGVSVVLSWAVPLTSVVGGFRLHRATDSGFTTGVATLPVPGAARSFTDTGLARDTVYHYRIQAGNAAGTSVVSRAVSIRTPA